MPKKKTFTCPRRIAEGRANPASPIVLEGTDLDLWDKNQQCSYDGSLHPDVFMDYIRSGKTVGVTDKPYKFYLDQHEGKVRGARKFYTHHLSEEQGWEFHQLWTEGKVAFDYPPPRLYIPGPSTRPRPDAG